MEQEVKAGDGRRTRSIRAVVVVVVVALVGLVMIWVSSSTSERQLLGNLDHTSPTDGEYVVWLSQPMQVLDALERELGVPVRSMLEEQMPASSLLDRALEALIHVDSAGVVSAEVRFHPATAVWTKALGILSAEPWLRGGAVKLGSERAAVAWRKGGRWVADRWQVRRQGSGTAVMATDVPASQSSALGTGEQEMVLKWAEQGRSPVVWSLAPIKPGEGLRFHQLEGEDARAGIKVQPWWTLAAKSPLLGRQAGSEFVLTAGQRRGSGWQFLTWLASPVVVNELSVNIELPRVASLESRGFDEAWPLPAEAVTRILAAKIEQRDFEGGLQVRASSSEARAWLESERSAIEAWVSKLEEGVVAAVIDPPALLQWAKAIRQMERTFGAASSLGTIEGLSESAQLTALVDRLPLIAVHWQASSLIVRQAQEHQ